MGVHNARAQKLSIGLVEEICRAPVKYPEEVEVFSSRFWSLGSFCEVRKRQAALAELWRFFAQLSGR
jgi:hypothetical protein